VGAVLVRDGQVVGEGYHRRAGGPHAEVEALRQAGDAARGATLYVTLEPCSHHGRTPPCADAVLEAGVVRVVACHRDPNPRVAGGGFQRLRDAGVEVEWGTETGEGTTRDAVALNLPFLTSQLLERPAVTVKWAMSLDGRIATASGESQWISSPRGRRWALALREEHDAIVVGSGTALADDPRLDRRLGKADGPILRVVLDRRLRLSPEARLFQVEGPVVVYTESLDEAPRRRLEKAGATVVNHPADGVTPATMLADLHRRGVQSVLVEGGGVLLASFVEARLFDRVAVDCAPLLIGGASAPGPLGGTGAITLAEAPRLADLVTRRRGGDVILEGLREGCLPDLLRSVAG
jgi:diaminohydroxyphosphoribosylaminopyrimidine deaminase/5-amino-6-(5-phosphoribosylamino)uracil reductase